ncbi:MAG: hypothetical protein AAGL69_10400 [Pseudomonadota bacterium]
MKDRTYIVIGLAGSAVWAVLFAAYALLNFSEIVSLEPNDLGDFLAGFFSPLALLWIVIGYFQQSHALQMQIAELNEQVESSNRLAKSAERQQQFASAEVQPRLQLRGQPTTKDDSILVKLVNDGEAALDLHLRSAIGMTSKLGDSKRDLNAGDLFEITVELGDEDATGELVYKDKFNQRWVIQLKFDRVANGFSLGDPKLG